MSDELRQALERAERAEVLLLASAQREQVLREALRCSQPWPVQELLRKLADAADHLLDVHDCDAHGWEGVRIAAGIARTVAANLDGANVALAAPSDPPATGEK